MRKSQNRKRILTPLNRFFTFLDRRLVRGLTCTLLVLTVAACVANVPAYTPVELDPSMRELPRGKIAVRGFLVFSPQGHVVYTNEEIYREIAAGDVSSLKENPYHCLTVANPDRLQEKGIGFGTQEIVIRGRMLPKYLGANEIDLGACGNETGFVVE